MAPSWASETPCPFQKFLLIHYVHQMDSVQTHLLQEAFLAHDLAFPISSASEQLPLPQCFPNSTAFVGVQVCLTRLSSLRQELGLTFLFPVPGTY